MTSPIHHCGTCTECVPTASAEHRGSRMPEHLTSVDPYFLDGVFRMFQPDDEAIKEKATDKEGLGGVR